MLAGGHLFLKLFQLASQKWLPKYQIDWERVLTGPIFLEPCSEHSLFCGKSNIFRDFAYFVVKQSSYYAVFAKGRKIYIDFI